MKHPGLRAAPLIFTGRGQAWGLCHLKTLIKLTLPNEFDDSLICAGDKFSSAYGTCAGDSGGPLLTDFLDRKSGEILYEPQFISFSLKSDGEQLIPKHIIIIL